MNRIYITHCTKKKNPKLKGTGKKVTPDELYKTELIQGFIKRCKEIGGKWAVFSDKFGVVFPDDKFPWYDKPPGSVIEFEYQGLLKNFVAKLSKYDEIWFYHNPGRFHPLYKRLVQDAQKKGMYIILFSHKDEIR
jgi:hypothetical protein